MNLSRKNILFILIAFTLAILLSLLIQYIRGGAPVVKNQGWRFQVVKALDQAGDLYHAKKEVELALLDPKSKNDALQWLQSIKEREKKAENTLVDLEVRQTVGMGVFFQAKLIFQQGIVYELLGEDQKAINRYQRSIQMKPKKSPAYLRLALIYERQQQFQEAEKYFNKAIKFKDQAYLTRFHYALFLVRSLQKKEMATEIANNIKISRPLYSKIIMEKINNHF